MNAAIIDVREILMPTSETKNLHVPLPGTLYRRLRAEADRSRRPATELAREAIDRWLADRQRRHIHDEILAYAREGSGTADDLDTELESAGLELLDAASDDTRPRQANNLARGAHRISSG